MHMLPEEQQKGLCFKWFRAKMKYLLRWNIHVCLIYELIAVWPYYIMVLYLVLNIKKNVRNSSFTDIYEADWLNCSPGINKNACWCCIIYAHKLGSSMQYLLYLIDSNFLCFNCSFDKCEVTVQMQILIRLVIKDLLLYLTDVLLAWYCEMYRIGYLLVL